jgi:tetratricopeptide (TPR) repeat protein
VRNQGKSVLVAFCALQNINETLVVRAGNRELLRERLALKPMEVYRKELPAAVANGELRVDIGDKLSYADDPKSDLLKRPLNFREYDESSLEGLYQNAEHEEKARNYDTALDKYLECLKREPQHMRALSRVAELYYRRAEYQTALEYARKALDFAMYDPDANYIYGVISRRMGELTDAKETFGWAARSMKYRSAAYGQLGEIYLWEGNRERALEFLRRALDYDAHNIKTQQVLSTAYRVFGQRDRAREVVSTILQADPLNHLARFEQYLLEPGPPNLEEFKSLIRNELPHETYLEAAMYYVSLGLEEDALRLLGNAPEQAEIRYWQAYLLRRKSPAQSRQMLATAAGLSPYLVFPFREESIPMFQWAAKAGPNDWKARYYLGLIYWGLRRPADALRMLNECGERPDYAPVYISRANLEKASDPTKALADSERAWASGKKEWRSWHHLATAYTERGMHDKALNVASEAAKLFPGEDLIKILLARTALNSGRYQECYGVLEKATILPFEGQRDVHELFVQCQMCSALAALKKGRYEEAVRSLEGSKEYPERLGTGKPANPDYRTQDYLLAFAYETMGQAAKAQEARQRIAGYTGRRGGGNAQAAGPAVEQWLRTTFQSETELKALQELFRLVRGSQRRRF